MFRQRIAKSRLVGKLQHYSNKLNDQNLLKDLKFYVDYCLKNVVDLSDEFKEIFEDINKSILTNSNLEEFMKNIKNSQ